MRKGTIDSSVYLFKQVVEKFSKSCWEILKETANVFLRSIELLDDMKLDIVSHSIQKVKELLNYLMIKSFEQPFGASILSSIFWSGKDAQSEIKVGL